MAFFSMWVVLLQGSWVSVVATVTIRDKSKTPSRPSGRVLYIFLGGKRFAEKSRDEGRGLYNFLYNFLKNRGFYVIVRILINYTSF